MEIIHELKEMFGVLGYIVGIFIFIGIVQNLHRIPDIIENMFDKMAGH